MSSHLESGGPDLEAGPAPAHQFGLAAVEASLGGRLPSAESQRVLAELTGLSLGTETVRTHAEQVGAQAEAVEQATIAHVLATQDLPPGRAAPIPADQQLVIETNGVMIRYRRSGWHEVKLVEWPAASSATAAAAASPGPPRTALGAA